MSCLLRESLQKTVLPVKRLPCCTVTDVQGYWARLCKQQEGEQQQQQQRKT
jgi:hypothetical protein